MKEKREILKGLDKRTNNTLLGMFIGFILFSFILMGVFIMKGNSEYSNMLYIMEMTYEAPTILDYINLWCWYILAFSQIGVIFKMVNQLLIWKTDMGIIKRILSHIELN